MANKYIVTAYVKFSRKREIITMPSTKAEAMKRAKQLKKNMKTSVSKYRWAKLIKVEVVK